MMIRFLCFTLFAALGPGLFNEMQHWQTAIMCLLAFNIFIIRFANARLCTAVTPVRIAKVYAGKESVWEAAVGRYVD